MKKKTAQLLAACFLMLLAACGGESTPEYKELTTVDLDAVAAAVATTEWVGPSCGLSGP